MWIVQKCWLGPDESGTSSITLFFPYWAPRNSDCDSIVMVILMFFLSLKKFSHSDVDDPVLFQGIVYSPIFYFTFSWLWESVVSIFHPGSSCPVNDRRQQSKNQFVIPTTDCKGQGVLSKTGRRKNRNNLWTWKIPILWDNAYLGCWLFSVHLIKRINMKVLKDSANSIDAVLDDGEDDEDNGDDV